MTPSTSRLHDTPQNTRAVSKWMLSMCTAVDIVCHNLFNQMPGLCRSFVALLSGRQMLWLTWKGRKAMRQSEGTRTMKYVRDSQALRIYLIQTCDCFSPARSNLGVAFPIINWRIHDCYYAYPMYESFVKSPRRQCKIDRADGLTWPILLPRCLGVRSP